MNFTEADYKTSSKAIIEAPLEVANAVGAKADAALAKADLLVKDNTNKLFFDNVLSTINSYHLELKNLNGTAKTNYDPNLLDAAARLAQGNVHLGGTWPNFVPKIHDSMNGLPVTQDADHEVFRLGELTDAIAALKTGFVDGNTSGTLSQSYSGGTSISPSVSFPVGSRILVGGNGVSALLKVVSVTVTPAQQGPPPVPASTNMVVEVLASTNGTIPQGAVIQNFFSGFTNTQRQNGTSSYPEVQQYFQNKVISQKNSIKNFINAQKAALDGNSATGVEKTNIQAAKAQADSALENISDWDALALTGVGAKFTDTGLQLLITTKNNRTTHATARQSEITSALGNVAQAAGGDYSGAGQYFSLSKWINLRINLSSGTLRTYYDTDQIDRFFDEQIKLANSKKSEFEAFMLAFQLKAGSEGSVVILESTTGLSAGNAVKIMDDDAPIMDATIVSISGNSVTLSAPISGYSLDKIARLVKPL